MTSLLTNPGPLEVKLRSTQLTLFLTVFQMMRMWKAYLRSWLQPKSIHFLEVVRESSGEGGGSHHKSSLSSSLVLQRRVTLYVHQLLSYSNYCACRSISLLDDNLTLAIRPSVVLPQDRQILPVNPLGQSLMPLHLFLSLQGTDISGCKHPKLRQVLFVSPLHIPSPSPLCFWLPVSLSLPPSLPLLPLPLPSQGGSIILYLSILGV